MIPEKFQVTLINKNIFNFLFNFYFIFLLLFQFFYRMIKYNTKYQLINLKNKRNNAYYC